jgi:hypothetical protein
MHGLKAENKNMNDNGRNAQEKVLAAAAGQAL